MFWCLLVFFVSVDGPAAESFTETARGAGGYVHNDSDVRGELLGTACDLLSVREPTLLQDALSNENAGVAADPTGAGRRSLLVRVVPEYADAIMDGDVDAQKGLSPMEAFADTEATALVSEFISTTALQLGVAESAISFEGITAGRRKLVVEDGLLQEKVQLRAREIGGSVGSPEPPDCLLTQLHTVCMVNDVHLQSVPEF
jgi:hypothetical protein